MTCPQSLGQYEYGDLHLLLTAELLAPTRRPVLPWSELKTFKDPDTLGLSIDSLGHMNFALVWVTVFLFFSGTYIHF